MNNAMYLCALIFLCGAAVWIGDAIVRLAIGAE